MIYTTYHVLCILIYCCFSFLAEYQTQGRKTVHIDVLIIWRLETCWLADFVLNLASDFVWFHWSVCLTLAQFYCRWCWGEALHFWKAFVDILKSCGIYQIFLLRSSIIPLFTWFAASYKSNNSAVAFYRSVGGPQKWWCHNYYNKIPFSFSVLFVFSSRMCKHG